MHEITNSSPTIFFVAEDNDVRRSLTKSLRELGYNLLVSADLEDAFDWTSGTGYIHADLVLVDLVRARRSFDHWTSLARAFQK